MTDGVSQIVVVGAGLTGLAFAIGARRHGYSVAVYDRKAAPVMPADISANVIAMNSSSTEFLTHLGAFEQVPDHYRPAYQQMRVFDAQGVGSVAFEASDAGLAFLGHIVDQRAMIAALANQAADVGVALHWQSSIEPTPSDCELLIAADGAHSQTRERLGFKKLRYEYEQTATVCVARLSRSHEQCAWQWFREDGPLALLPLANQNEVAVVWSSSTDKAALDSKAFSRALVDATENRMGEVESLSDRFGFPLMQLQTLRYVAPGVALLGDAAHAIHPLAGQGANLGLADAAALVSEVGAARLEGRTPGDIVLLRRYERARRAHNHTAGMAMEGFHQLFTNRSPLLSLMRNQGMRFVQKNSFAKSMAMRVASGAL